MLAIAPLRLVDGGRRRRRRRRPGADEADDVSQHLDDLPDGGRVLAPSPSASGRRSTPRCCRSSPTTCFSSSPFYTFTVARPHELLALFIFLAISVVTSTMAGRIREQAQLAVRAHARDAAALRVLAPAVGRRLATTTSRRRRSPRSIPALGRPAVVLLAVDGEVGAACRLAAGRGARHRLDDGGTLGDRARRAGGRRYGDAARGAVAVPAAEDGPRGVRRRRRRPRRRRCRGSMRRRARCWIRLPSRRQRRSTAPRSHARWWRRAAPTETERVRNTLLASISHDFRTPLASILGSATSLIDYGDKLGD